MGGAFRADGTVGRGRKYPLQPCTFNPDLPSGYGALLYPRGEHQANSEGAGYPRKHRKVTSGYRKKACQKGRYDGELYETEL